MTSLRCKLWFGFGAVLAILVIVSALCVAVLTRYSHALERVLRENYDSAVYCDAMKDALDQLNLGAQELIWESAGAMPPADHQRQIERFETNLRQQLGNTTLPGEADLSEQLRTSWGKYRAVEKSFGSSQAPQRAQLYRGELLPQYRQLKQLAQRVADMNMRNVDSVDGKVKRTLASVRSWLLILVVAGGVLTSLFIAGVGASILESIRALTRSARDIEAGNLDQVVPVGTHDEMGQLASAFNSMASKLREFRKLDHERLLRTQRTTQLAIDSLPDAVFVIGPGGKVEISNSIATRHFRIAPGSSVAELGLPWLSGIYQSVREQRQAFEPSGYHSAIQLFDQGQERFLLPHAVPMLDGNGSVVGVTVIVVDVTRLRHADEAKMDLVSTVSHELRTPLTSIRMGMLMLAGAKLGPLTERQQKSLNAARDDADRLHRIIENLLSMARLESGRSRFRFRHMTAGEIIGQAVDPLREAFAQKGVALSVEVAEDLPPVLADPSCIHLALSNLLSNALKFTPAGGRAEVCAAASGDSLVVCVRDNGPGIAPEYAQKIFEKFFRVPNEQGPGGAGLGLTIAKEIAEVHGGTIRVESSPKGAAFFLTLPFASEPVYAACVAAADACGDMR